MYFTRESPFLLQVYNCVEKEAEGCVEEPVEERCIRLDNHHFIHKLHLAQGNVLTVGPKIFSVN